jgi:hypothetical protein
MLDKLTGKPIHSIIQFIGILTLAVGLPLSKIPLSLGLMLLGLNVILYWDWKNVWIRWTSSKPLIFLVASFFIILVSLLWTSDYGKGMNNIRIIIPFFTIPLAITAIPLSNKKYYYIILLSFIISVFVTSLINVCAYFHWWGAKKYDDIRSLSLFISHIRFSMLVIMALALCIGWWIKKLPAQFLSIPLIIWFIFYTNLAQIGTGYLTLAGITLLAFVFILQRIRSKVLKITIFSLLLIGLSFVVGYFIIHLKPIPPKIKLTDNLRQTTTALGNSYYFAQFDKVSWENGYPVYAFLADSELRSEWNKVSKIPYDSTDLKGSPIQTIVIRYMTSKGLKKDAADFQKLTKKDIQNMENGMTSIEMEDGGLKSFLYQLKFQLKYMENPNGKSFLERVEFLKVGLHILKSNWMLGVGVGDIDTAFKYAYEQQKSKLFIENRHITHNQYITFWIIGGIVCFISFLLIWYYQLKFALKKQSFVWLSFIVISLLSFCVEDTLHTQVGATFTAFFMGLFIQNSGNNE